MNLTKEQFIDLHEEAAGTRMINAVEVGDIYRVWDYMFYHKTGLQAPAYGQVVFTFEGVKDGLYQIKFN